MGDIAKGSGPDLPAFGQSFRSVGLETQYRAWRRSQTLPLMRIAAVLSLSGWITAPAVLYFWNRPAFDQVLPWLAGIVLPIFVVGTAICLHPRAMRWALPTVVILQILGGCAVGLMVLGVGGSAGGAVAWILFVALFAPLMQLPPMAATIGVAPYTLLILGLTARSWQAGELGSVDAFCFLLAPVMTLATVVLACAFIERVARTGFLAEQTIARQKHQLERSRALIRRYVPRSVAERIEAGDALAVDAPQRRRITILFSDMVGFTNLADRVDPESLTQVIGEYMATMSGIVERHGGTLNEFIGDGLMALFGAPVESPPEEQARRAIETAFAMHAALPQLNERWLKLGIGQPLQVRIGINTGVSSVGSFGSEGRMTYTAIGLQTNIAARIQAQCEPGSILISDSSWHLVKADLPCQFRGEIQFKGLHFPVGTYQPDAAAVA